MRKLVLLLLLSALVVLPAAAQTPPRNVAYGELLGNGIILTVNYERGFTDRVFGRIGFSYVTGESENDTDSTFIIPVMVNYVTRPQANHHLEAGAGFTLLTGDSQDLFDDEIEDENFSNLVATGTLGYRYQRPGKGFVFRAGFTPLVSDGGVLPWVGVSFGYGW